MSGKKIAFVFFVVFTLAVTSGLANAGVGNVQTITPNAWASQAGQYIALSQGQALDVNYSLHTDSQGALSIRFADGSQLSLEASTSVELTDFAYDASPSFVMNIGAGAARIVTGAIVEQNPDGFLITTPLGTVGVRGTTLRVMVSNDKVTVQTLQIEPGHTVVVTGLDNVSVTMDAPNTQVDLLRGEPTPPEASPLRADSVAPPAMPEEESTGYAELPHRDVGDQFLMPFIEQLAIAGEVPLPDTGNILPKGTVYPTFALGLPAGMNADPATFYASTTLWPQMSADAGTVVSYTLVNGGADIRYNLWKSDGTYVDLGTGTYGTAPSLGALALSRDGNTLAYAFSDGVNASRVLDLGTGTQYLLNGNPGGLNHVVMSAINHNGQYVAGYYDDGSPTLAIWSFDGTAYNFNQVQDGGGFNLFGAIYAVSDDMGVLAGTNFPYGTGFPAIWQRISGYQYNETVLTRASDNLSYEGQVTALTPDGSVFVGFELDPVLITSYSFRGLTVNGQYDLLPVPADGTGEGMALAISDNGQVVVGSYQLAGGMANDMSAYFWSANTNTSTNINSHLTANGVNLGAINLASAYQVSGDGSIVLCMDNNDTNYYLVRLDGPTIGLTTPSNVWASLAGVQAGGDAAPVVNSLLNQLPGISLAMGNVPAAGEGGSENVLRIWGSGTFMSDYAFNGDDRGGVGAVGATYFMSNGFSVGGGVFYGYRDTESLWNSRQEMESISFGLYGGYAPEVTGIRLSLGVIGQSYDLDSTRNYPNGAGMATSTGKGSGWGMGLVGHAGWVFELHEKVTIQPFVEYTFQRTATPDYEENGGPFPVSYDREYFNQNITRLGADLQWDVLPMLNLQLWLAWNHRFEDEGPASSGRVIGWQSFYLNGADLKQNWGDTGLGLRWRFMDNTTLGFRLGFGIDNHNSGLPDVMSTLSLSVDL